MSNDSVNKIKIRIKQKNQRAKQGGISDITTSTGYVRTYYKVSNFWCIAEEALLKEMMKNEAEYSRAALVRRCIHERAMRTLGSEKYYKIIQDPEKCID